MLVTGILCFAGIIFSQSSATSLFNVEKYNDYNPFPYYALKDKGIGVDEEYSDSKDLYDSDETQDFWGQESYNTLDDDSNDEEDQATDIKGNFNNYRKYESSRGVPMKITHCMNKVLQHVDVVSTEYLRNYHVFPKILGNVSCVSSEYQTHQPSHFQAKCIAESRECKTKYRAVPIFIKRNGTDCWKFHKEINIGVGCECFMPHIL